MKELLIVWLILLTYKYVKRGLQELTLDIVEFILNITVIIPSRIWKIIKMKNNLKHSTK